MSNPESKVLPVITEQEVAQKILRSQWIQIRVTPERKDRFKAVAASLGMSVSEYLLSAGELVADKLNERPTGGGDGDTGDLEI